MTYGEAHQKTAAAFAGLLAQDPGRVAAAAAMESPPQALLRLREQVRVALVHRTELLDQVAPARRPDVTPQWPMGEVSGDPWGVLRSIQASVPATPGGVLGDTVSALGVRYDDPVLEGYRTVARFLTVGNDELASDNTLPMAPGRSRAAIGGRAQLLHDAAQCVEAFAVLDERLGTVGVQGNPVWPLRDVRLFTGAIARSARWESDPRVDLAHRSAHLDQHGIVRPATIREVGDAQQRLADLIQPAPRTASLDVGLGRRVASAQMAANLKLAELSADQALPDVAGRFTERAQRWRSFLDASSRASSVVDRPRPIVDAQQFAIHQALTSLTATRQFTAEDLRLLDASHHAVAHATGRAMMLDVSRAGSDVSGQNTDPGLTSNVRLRSGGITRLPFATSSYGQAVKSLSRTPEPPHLAELAGPGRAALRRVLDDVPPSIEIGPDGTPSGTYSPELTPETRGVRAGEDLKRRARVARDARTTAVAEGPRSGANSAELGADSGLSSSAARTELQRLLHESKTTSPAPRRTRARPKAHTDEPRETVAPPSSPQPGL